MAGTQDPNENPVAINVVPMVDVIFCLCVFFMCSFQFRQQEGRLSSWLPKDQGSEGGVVRGALEEIRVALDWDPVRATTTRRLGARAYARDAELEQAIRGAREAWASAGRPRAPVILDGSAGCPWHAVVGVLNSVRRLGIQEVELAMGPPARVR